MNSPIPYVECDFWRMLLLECTFCRTKYELSNCLLDLSTGDWCSLSDLRLLIVTFWQSVPAFIPNICIHFSIVLFHFFWFTPPPEDVQRSISREMFYYLGFFMFSQILSSENWPAIRGHLHAMCASVTHYDTGLTRSSTTEFRTAQNQVSVEFIALLIESVLFYLSIVFLCA